MKTKYMVLAAIAGLTAAVCFMIFRSGKKGTKAHEDIKKQTAYAEKHIRDVMNKSKLAL